MREFELDKGLVIPLEDYMESHIWLEPELARDLARNLINIDAIFSYLPVSHDEVEIVAFADDLAKCLRVYVEVK